MSLTANVYTKVRGEIAALFGWNVESLSPEQALRLDTAAALRLALDDLQGKIVRGEAVDITKMLTASEALARLLPPAVCEAEQRDDRDAAVAPLLKLFRHLHESVHTLSAENARLKAALKAGGFLGHDREEATPAHSLSDVPMVVERVAINPSLGDITPPAEIGVAYVGTKPGPDDPKPPVTIEGKVVPSAPAAGASASRQPTWDDTPGGRAWRAWVDAGGGGFDRWGNHNV
jgi:hypothetical protein